MRQPQFIMLAGGGKASWINLSEIIRADIEATDHIVLHLKSGTEVRLENRQDVEYVMLMLNSLSELPKPNQP